MFACRESGVIEDDSISGDFDNFPEGKVRQVKIQEEIETKSLYSQFFSWYSGHSRAVRCP